MKTNARVKDGLHPAWCLALWAGSMGLGSSALAIEVGEPGGLNGHFDTTLSYGSAWRLQDRDPTLVGAANGGRGSVNGDDGNLDYAKGKAFSSLFKSIHELELNYRNFGFFGRGYLFYDVENANRTGRGPIAANGAQGSGYALGPLANERVGRGAKLLDAYVRGNFEFVDGLNTQVRVGSQVVSWGEGTYIQNGINVANAYDLARLRSPGSELKEALLPTPMVWASQAITKNVSAEAFGIARFHKVKLDPRGSYFSTTDLISDDSTRYYLAGPDQHFPAVPGQSRSFDRARDRNASNGGEYGLALRVLAPELNQTEFGLYHVNYHLRTPIISARRGGLNVAGVPVPINAPTSSPAAAAANYFVEYPKDIHLFGVSANTAAPWGIALQGEYSYRPNMPLQRAVGEVFLAALGLSNSLTGSGATANAVAAGTEISGVQRVKMHQVQMTATKALPTFLGSDQVVLLGEVGYTRLALPAGVLFAGYGETTAIGSFGAPAIGAGQGFATRSSWGYQVNASADYSNAIGGVRLSPRLSFSQSVHGVSPTWNEGVKSVGVGLGASLKEWRGDIGYTAFFGGRVFNDTINTNTLKDRDFIAASVSYSF